MTLSVSVCLCRLASVSVGVRLCQRAFLQAPSLIPSMALTIHPSLSCICPVVDLLRSSRVVSYYKVSSWLPMTAIRKAECAIGMDATPLSIATGAALKTSEHGL